MKNIFYLSAFFVVLLCSCTSDKLKIADTPLFMVDSHDSFSSKSKLSEIFKGYKLVKLETNDSCLIGGRGNKIIKYDSCFYVLSQNTILRFDKDGRYLNKLDKVGNGPEDYISIFDFNVLAVEGTDEIWLSTIGGIKIYDVETCSFKRLIPIEGFVNQFRYVDSNTILVVCPEDTIFKVCNIDGSVRSKFWKKDLANAGYKFNQFFSYQNKIVYQIDDTQTGVVYEMDKDSMYFQNIIGAEDKLLTLDINKDYYDRFGYEEQPIKISENYIRTSTIRTLNGKIFMTQFYPNGEKKITICADGSCVNYSYGVDTGLENDITQTKGLLFLSTIICCEGDDSFIFMIPSEMMIGSDNEDNPCLLEVFI